MLCVTSEGVGKGMESGYLSAQEPSRVTAGMHQSNRKVMHVCGAWAVLLCYFCNFSFCCQGSPAASYLRCLFTPVWWRRGITPISISQGEVPLLQHLFDPSLN